MPLKKGSSKEVISDNISELEKKKGGRRNRATAAPTSVNIVFVKDR